MREEGQAARETLRPLTLLLRPLTLLLHDLLHPLARRSRKRILPSRRWPRRTDEGAMRVLRKPLGSRNLLLQCPASAAPPTPTPTPTHVDERTARATSSPRFTMLNHTDRGGFIPRAHAAAPFPPRLLPRCASPTLSAACPTRNHSQHRQTTLLHHFNGVYFTQNAYLISLRFGSTKLKSIKRNRYIKSP